MKRAEFVECCKLAVDTEIELPSYLSVQVVEMFDALRVGLRVVATKQVFAGAVRGQAMAMTGELLQAEVQSMEQLSRCVDIIG